MSKDRTLSTAVHLLVSLAHNNGRLVSSEELARGLCTNPGLVRRVLSKLSQAGLIETIKGQSGGSRLAKRSEDITLDLIYLAVVDAPLFGAFDKEPFKACPVSCSMNTILLGVYDELESHLLENMKAKNLAMLVKQV